MEETDQASPAVDSCPDCHALVADLDAHKHWHSRLVADIATAVDKEARRRSAAAG